MSKENKLLLNGKNLPEGWGYFSLNQLCDINPKRPKLLRADSAETIFIPMAAVSAEKGAIIDSQIKPYSEVKKGYTYFEEGDVLFAKITPCMQNGKHFIAKDLIDKIGFASTEFHVIRPGKSITREWIHLYLRQDNVLKEAINHFTGSAGQQRVPDDFLRELLIPVPLLIPEQKRVLVELKKKLTALDKAKQAAEKQLADIKLLPRALLRQTFDVKEKMPKNWQIVKLDDVLNYEQPTPYIVRSTKYDNNFKTPVLTAGKSFVLGYTDEMDNIYPANKLPVIIFDDFTTAIQYVDFPFKVKSSAMKILSLKDNSLDDIRYIYNIMRNIEFDATTHKRYWITEYSKIKFIRPTFSDQKQIAVKLSRQLFATEKARCIAEQQIFDINQLKNALIQEIITP